MQKRIRFVNKSTDARREYGVATVPFKKGEWFGNPDLVHMKEADERPFVIKAFGARYGDGSYRYGQGYFPLSMAGRSETIVHLNVDSTQLGGPVPNNPITLPTSYAAPVIINGLAPSNMFVDQMEANAARTVIRVRYRMGDFVVEAYVYFYKEQGHWPFELRVTASNPNSSLLSYQANSIVLTMPGTTVGIYGGERKGVARVDGSTVVLASNTSFGDGQSQCWYGNIYLQGDPDRNVFAAEGNPLWGISLDWKDSEAFGPFGTVPEALTTDVNLKRQYAETKYSEFRHYKNTAGNLWDDLMHGLTKVPGAAGDQRDFGMMMGWDAVDSGHPELLEAYRFCATEEAMRPGHYKESNGLPVTSANHPNWVTWNGVTHWHPVLSPDKLGKVGGASAIECHEWQGKDNEHWSSNLLSAAALLTHSYQLVDELNVEAELFLSGHTIQSMKPNWSTNAMGPSRGVGRTYHAMAQNYLITGREDIKTRVVARTQQSIVPQWAGRNTSIVRPLFTIGPDYRQLPEHPSWLPWQECLGIPGLESWYQITGLELFREIAIPVAASMVSWGWRVRYSEQNPEEIILFDAGSAVRWYPDGSPITPEQYFDETRTYYCASGIMHAWCVTALKIVKDYYQGHVSEDVCNKANKLLTLITANRSGVYDRMGEWLV